MNQGISVLVVDDSMSIRAQLRQALEAEGFVVVEAEHGLQGLERCRESDIGFVIVDVNMPVMGGLEMIVKLRELERYAKTPIFVLTTESGVGTAKHGKAAGATAWIVKPVSPDALIRGMRGVLARDAAGA